MFDRVVVMNYTTSVFSANSSFWTVEYTDNASMLHDTGVVTLVVSWGDDETSYSSYKHGEFWPTTWLGTVEGRTIRNTFCKKEAKIYLHVECILLVPVTRNQDLVIYRSSSL